MKVRRKKPSLFDAIQWDGTEEQAHAAIDAFTDSRSLYMKQGNKTFLAIETEYGESRASPGDWIIRGGSGALYSCNPDVFQATYEAVDDESPAIAPVPSSAPASPLEDPA